MSITETKAAAVTIEELLQRHDESRRVLDSVDRLFVIGCGNSGTTWLRNMLHGHPNIVIYGEGGFAWRLIPFLAQAVNSFNEHQKKGQPAVTQLSEVDFRLLMRLLIDNTFFKYIEESGKPIAQITVVGDKTPQHTIGIPMLYALYPSAKFVHIYRDPRDVATSAWFHDGVHDPERNFEQFIHHFMNEVWPLQVGTAREVGPQLGNDRYLEVRYEDIIKDERSELARILRFVRVDNCDEILDMCHDAGAFEKMTGGRARGDGDNTKYYRKGIAGDWVNHLPREMVVRFCKPIAELMRSCGYEVTV